VACLPIDSVTAFKQIKDATLNIELKSPLSLS
jgi:hypothetical protein